MKFLALLLVVATFAQGSVLPYNNAYGYLRNSVEKAEKLRLHEEKYLSQRIVGGSPAEEEEIPYQAGLIIDLIGINGNGICGGTLVSNSRIVTAAHCWYDGMNQAWKFTVVLGSSTLFSGGTRLETSVVVTHPNWFPTLVRNDIAVIYLLEIIDFSSTISPAALPSRADQENDFANENAIVSGYGLTVDGGNIPSDQVLSKANVNVTPNSVCRFSFPLILQDSNICTSGLGGSGPCGGDSGGPLVLSIDDILTLIGTVSFGSALGCEANLPAAYARTTSYLDFLELHTS